MNAGLIVEEFLRESKDNNTTAHVVYWTQSGHLILLHVIMNIC